MRKWTSLSAGALLVVAGVMAGGPSGASLRAASPQAAAPAQVDLDTPDESLLRWPLPPGAEKYAAIDGKRMHRDVVAQALISRRYRDRVHPKFWGRIIGSSSDAESAEWLDRRFRAIGLSDVRIQPLDLGPQWMAQMWDVAVTSEGKTIHLDSAQPNYAALPTPAGGLDLDAVYVGLGTEADYAGKDVKGKAVFYYTQVGLQVGTDWTGLAKRAETKGAAAIFEVDMLPGNMRYQGYPSNTKSSGVHRGQR